jgi:hypothetical protein
MRAAYFLTRDPSVFKPPLRDRPPRDHPRFRRTREYLGRAARLVTRREARPARPLPASER